MGKEIITNITVNAPPSVVWRVLTDFNSWKDWNTFIVKMQGKPEEGETLTATFNNGFVISPRLVVVEPDKRVIWKGKLACGGLFDGEHRFILTPTEDGTRTTLEHAEKFSGLLIVLSASLLKDTEQNFVTMNQLLNTRCEQVL